MAVITGPWRTISILRCQCPCNKRRPRPARIAVTYTIYSTSDFCNTMYYFFSKNAETAGQDNLTPIKTVSCVSHCLAGQCGTTAVVRTGSDSDWGRSRKKLTGQWDTWDRWEDGTLWDRWETRGWVVLTFVSRSFRGKNVVYPQITSFAFWSL